MVAVLFLGVIVWGTFFSNRAVAQESSIPNPFEYLPPEVPADKTQSPVPKTPAIQDAAAEIQDFKDGEDAKLDDVPAEASELGKDDPVAKDLTPELPDRVDDAPNTDAVLEAKYANAFLIDLRGPIFGRFHWYMNNRLDQAKREGADLVILRLTTPGGDLEHSLQIARRLRDMDWAEVVVFIPEEAISGGAIVSLGADRIYMRKGALIGDAGPIRLGPGGQFEHVEEKVVSYLAEAIRELAESGNRPGAIAEAMVDRNLAVFEATEIATGKRTFLTEADASEAERVGKVRLGAAIPEAGQNRFLTVDANRAQDLQICDGVFASEQELLKAFQIASIKRTELTWVDGTVFVLNLPWLTALLLIVGLIGLYIELAAPGVSGAGVFALGCFGLFFWSRVLGGTSGWLEVLLFSLGIVCLVCEIFVLPGFGLFGVSGIFLVVVSLVMASQDFMLPTSPVQWSQLRGNTVLVLGVLLGVSLLFFGQLFLFDSLPGLSFLRLEAPEVSQVPDFSPNPPLTTSAETGQVEALTVGRAGVAESDLRPSGKVIIDGRLVDVVTEGDYVSAGTAVEILKIEGNRVVVRRGAVDA